MLRQEMFVAQRCTAGFSSWPRLCREDTGGNFSPAQGLMPTLRRGCSFVGTSCQGGQHLEMLITSSPSQPHPQLMVVLQSGLSQQQDLTGQAGEVEPVLEPASDSWAQLGSISSALDGKVDKNSFRNSQVYLGWPGFPTQHRNSPCPCQAVNTLLSWRAKHIGADSAWKT